jgi:hypothetical protein
MRGKVELNVEFDSDSLAEVKFFFSSLVFR